jgi:hypothetical protein
MTAPPPAPAVQQSTAIDLGQLAAAVTAVVGIFVSLAATGVLGQAERNHGTLLLIGIGFVLLGVLFWAVAAVRPGRWNAWLHIPGALSFLAGLGIGIGALIATQQDSERPAVSASFDQSNRLLTATVTADGLSSEDRVAVRIEGLKQKGKTTRLEPVSTTPLYFSLLGPGADGKVKHTAIALVPKTYTYVGAKAWTANTEPACFLDAQLPKGGSQSHEAGCFVLKVQPPTKTTKTPNKKS